MRKNPRKNLPAENFFKTLKLILHFQDDLDSDDK